MALIITVLGLLLPTPWAYAQRQTVKGVVIDETDTPVAGAYIFVKGDTRGAMTDVNGRFSIDVSPRDVLVASFIGYSDEEVHYQGVEDVIVKLVPMENVLEEAVKVAYGTQRKASIIGSISTVDMETLASPMGTISTGLAGKLAGVVAMQRSGEPGASADFWIRGISTFGEYSKPLILVDGVEREMDLVDVEDIASFSILKDATATALYGVRGANGIVLITTRRGGEHKPQVNIKMETGVVSPVKLPEMASTEEFIDYLNALFTENGNDAPISPTEKERYLTGYDPELYPSVDWVHETFKNVAQTHKVNVNVTGGTKNVRYYVAGSYYFEDGILKVADNDRYDAQMNFQKFSFRSNVDINITKSTILGLSLGTQVTLRNYPGSTLDDILSLTMRNTPIVMPTVYLDGTLAEVENTNNPYNLINESGYRTTTRNTATSTISLTQDFSDIITEGLSAKVQLSWDAWNQTALSRIKTPSTYKATARLDDGSLEYKTMDDYQGYMTLSSVPTGNNTLDFETSVLYERNFANAHRVSGMLLYSLRERWNNVPYSYLAAFAYKNMGLAGRATYSFKDRYFAEANFGYNGSENFAPGHRMGFFPSVALGWMPSNEDWWDPVKDVVDMLKLKASVGQIGNDQIGGGRRYVYNATVLTSGVGGANWGSNEANYVAGMRTGEIANPDVSWETSTKSNVGIELSLFKDFSLQAEWFYQYRDGIFLQRESLPSAVGINVAQYVNVGKMKNGGIDLSGEYNHLFSNGLSLSLRGTYTFNRNHIIFNDQPAQVEAYQSTAGFAYLQQRGLIAEGLFCSQEEIDEWPVQKFGNVRPGDIKYRDVNGDGVVDEYDKVPIGYTTVPEITYGFGLSSAWKGFDFSFYFSGVDHVTRIIGGSQFWGGTSTTARESGQIYRDVALNHWTVENPRADAKYPRISLSKAENNQQASTYWQRDMSFLRLKNVEFGYTIPKKVTKKIGIQTLRVYVQGLNLLTFSKFDLWDPEIDASYGNCYPITKNVSLGLNLNF